MEMHLHCPLNPFDKDAIKKPSDCPNESSVLHKLPVKHSVFSAIYPAKTLVNLTTTLNFKHVFPTLLHFARSQP